MQIANCKLQIASILFYYLAHRVFNTAAKMLAFKTSNVLFKLYPYTSLFIRWFTIGSILFVATSVMILVNSYDDYLGSDDSTLNTYSYRISWILMIVCGIFCTLGTLFTAVLIIRSS